MRLSRVAALCLATVMLAGCFGSGRHQATARASKTKVAALRADLAAARAALGNGSGILAPFSPARLGRTSCPIPRGGMKVAFLRGICETRVLRRAGERLVIFSESWNARDFGCSCGKRFRQPRSRRRLQTSWLVTVTASRQVRHVRVHGDFAPQFVM
jgi:hypothetical protein